MFVDLWRLIFTSLIIANHSGNYSDGWYIGVDFFFIVSGFLCVNEAQKSLSTGQYINKRVKKLYPHMLFSFIVVFSYMMWCLKSSPRGILILLGEHFFEMIPGLYFMTDIDHLGFYAYNYPVWYVSSLLICSCLMFYLAQKHKSVFLK